MHSDDMSDCMTFLLRSCSGLGYDVKRHLFMSIICIYLLPVHHKPVCLFFIFPFPFLSLCCVLKNLSKATENFLIEVMLFPVMCHDTPFIGQLLLSCKKNSVAIIKKFSVFPQASHLDVMDIKYFLLLIWKLSVGGKIHLLYNDIIIDAVLRDSCFF